MNELPIMRTLLYIPGNNPGMINSCGIYDVDCIVFDLEDSVPIAEKDSARILIRNSLNKKDLLFPKRKLMVRINHLETGYGKNDIETMISAGCNLLRIPKIESVQDINDVEKIIRTEEKKNNLPENSVKIIAILETVKGVSNVESIASSSKRLLGLTLGAEDFTRDMGTERSREGNELNFARGKILLAAKNNGILAIDTVFSDVADPEGLENETKKIKQLGFDGKSIIHPSQAEIIHKIFTPTVKDIDHAVRVEIAMKEAEAKGSAAVAVDGKMVDTPVLKKAKRVLVFARRLGLIE